MGRRYSKKLILAKIEAVSGTKEVLAAADAVLGTNVELTPLAGDTVSRELERAYFGNSDQVPVNTHMVLSFRVELASSGAKGTAPAWGKLLQASAFAEIVSAGTKVDYTPVSDNEKTISLALNIDGQLHELHGARGTFTLSKGANQVPYLNFTFTGLFNTPSSTAAVAGPSYDKFKDPLIGSNTNTPTFEFHGNSDLALSSLSYDHANEISHRELINANNEVVLSGRAPTGSITIDTPKYSDLNLIDRAKKGTKGALQVVHGTADGAIVEVNMPNTGISSVSNSESDGIWQQEVGITVLPKATAGNDEIKITAR